MKIKKGRMTVGDTMDRLVEDGEGIKCGCGAPELTIVFHMDGVEWYSYQYSCSCGNQIYMRVEREIPLG